MLISFIKIIDILRNEERKEEIAVFDKEYNYIAKFKNINDCYISLGCDWWGCMVKNFEVYDNEIYITLDIKLLMNKTF